MFGSQIHWNNDFNLLADGFLSSETEQIFRTLVPA
jgi:hypothetical protein